MEVPVLRKLEAERVELVTCSDMSLLRVTTSFVESAGLAFGLGEDETLASLWQWRKSLFICARQSHIMTSSG